MQRENEVRDFDTIVIGAGAAGSSTAYSLAQRGQSVLLLEQFGIGHDRGSTFGPSRIFRFAYDQAIYVRMARRALDLWRALEADAGLQLYWPTGILSLGLADSPNISGLVGAMTDAEAEFERLSAPEVMQRFPQWRIPDDWQGVYTEFGGIVNPSLTVDILVALARVYGATVRDHTPVQRLDLSDPQAPAVVTEAGTFTARKVVISAGAWLTKLVPQWQSRFTVQENLTVFFRPQRLEPFQMNRFPVFIQEDGQHTYGFPVFGLPGVKVALHSRGDTVDPDGRTRQPKAELIDTLRQWLERHLPEAAGPVMEARTCLYTNTRSEDFVFDHHPQSQQVVIVSACSGHGFKFTPLLGELTADLVQGLPNEFLKPKFTVLQAT